MLTSTKTDLDFKFLLLLAQVVSSIFAIRYAKRTSQSLTQLPCICACAVVVRR